LGEIGARRSAISEDVHNHPGGIHHEAEDEEEEDDDDDGFGILKGAVGR